MNTPLHTAIQNGNIEIIKTLLAGGCETIHARNADGQTPLDLAIAMNSEEIVRLLLEHGAGHLPPNCALVILNTEQRKKRISFFTTLICVLLGVLAFGDVVYSLICIAVFSVEHQRSVHTIAGIMSTIYVFLFIFPLFLAYVFCYFFWLFRLWEEVPRQFARLTPETSAFLSLVPFFNWYWMFVALGGLFRDMNQAMEGYGSPKRFNTTLITVSCFIWLVNNLVSLLCVTAASIASAMNPGTFFQTELVLNVVSSAIGILWCLFTITVYWLIRKNVFEFMDIKTGLEHANCSES